ncbi:MAG: hypothetical protein ACRDFX_06300, partial [Chloroflexota bacterium]
MTCFHSSRLRTGVALLLLFSFIGNGILRAQSGYASGVTQVVTNGGFETGVYPWNAVTYPYHGVIVYGPARTGRYVAELCPRLSCIDSISQTVLIPYAVTQATLSYDIRVTGYTRLGGCTSTVTVTLNSSADTSAPLDNLCASGIAGRGWIQRTIAVTAAVAAAWGPSRLTLAGTKGFGWNTMLIDNVSLTVATSEGAPVSAPPDVATPTATPSPAPSPAYRYIPPWRFPTFPHPTATPRAPVPTPTPIPTPTQRPTVAPYRPPIFWHPPTRIPASTPTPSPSPTPTRTPFPTPTRWPTFTPRPTPSPTFTPRPTATPWPIPTSTPTPSPVFVPTSTPTPWVFPTFTPTPTPGFVPTPTPTSQSSGQTGSPGAPVALGARINDWGLDAPNDATAIDNYARMTGKMPAIVMWFQDWGEAWPGWSDRLATSVYQRGAVPMITWDPCTSCTPSDTSFSLAGIVRGNYDSFIRQWALGAAHWGHPFFLRFAHEMNGNWYPWGTESGNVQRNTPT